MVTLRSFLGASKTFGGMEHIRASNADKFIIVILNLKLVHLLQHSVHLLQSITESACWFSAVHTCTPNTRVSCLCLSGDKMAALASTNKTGTNFFESYHMAAFWVPWSQGENWQNNTVCKVCRTQLQYFSNTTNLRNDLAWYHPELGEKQWPVADASQRTIEQAVAQLQLNPERAKRITKSIASFIALDLRPYSVVENVGFQTMVFTLEPRYKIPSRRDFTDTATPTLYKETKTEGLDTLMKEDR